jgi:lipid-binding SYLF domain-containing protein
MKDSNVVELDVATSLDVPVERILRKAADADLDSAVVIGYDQDGGFYFGCSVADGAETLWLLELAKKRLLEMVDDAEA